ncbi:MAG: hypothetical protein AAGH46_10145 [Bacteroidota bacterium]
MTKSTSGIIHSGLPGIKPTENRRAVVTTILMKVIKDEAVALSDSFSIAIEEAVENIDGRPKKMKNIGKNSPHGPIAVNNDKDNKKIPPNNAIQNPMAIVLRGESLGPINRVKKVPKINPAEDKRLKVP